MRLFIRVPAALPLALALAASPATAQPLVPAAPRVDSSDTYFGTVVADPYRWLEAYDTPAVRAWYEAEDAAARAFLDARPAQAHVLRQFAEARAARTTTLGAYVEAGGRLVYLMRLPDEEGPSVYVRDAFDPERLLLAPAAIGQGAVIGSATPSPTGEHVVVGATVGGVESAPVVRVVEAATGRVLDELPPRAVVTAWLPDGQRFLYVVFREGGPDATGADVAGGAPVLVHTLGVDARTDPDPVVFDVAAHGGDAAAIAYASVPTPETDLVFVAWLTEASDRWDATFVAPLAAVEAGRDAWHPVSVPADSVIGVFARGAHLYGVAFRGEPTGRLVRLPMPPDLLVGGPRPDWTQAQTVVPAGGVNFWMQPGRVAFASDAVYTVETVPGLTRLFRTTYDGVREEIAAPAQGAFEQPVAHPARPGVDVVHGGWAEARRRYRYSPATGRLDALPAFYNPPNPFGRLDGLTAETVLVPSHDGVEVPLTLLRVPSASGAGPRPTILYGYGAYGYTNDPSFRAQFRPWLAAGGQVAYCHVRGGGYFGAAWYEAGQRASKPNTWLDGVACAEHLVRAGLARPEQIGINGESAGGIFVGRAMTERPDLFGAAVAEVGVADMVRFVVGSFGPTNVFEFGSPETEAGFEGLLAMSPLHHVEVGVRYPATLLYAAFNDARVAPWHPGKLAAALRHVGGEDALPDGARPVLLYVDFEAGHGLTDTVSSGERRRTAVLAFFADRLGLAMP